MHIKHYHRELRKILGSTPKVLDLAYARTMPTEAETPRNIESKVLKVKINRLPKREESKGDKVVNNSDVVVEPTTPVSVEAETVKTQDSPKLRDALVNKPVKRPKVLLPVRRLELEPDPIVAEDVESVDNFEDMESPVDTPTVEQLDFETAICTHTVTKPTLEKRRRRREEKEKEKRRGEENEKKSVKRMKTFAAVSQEYCEEEEWLAVNSDFESRSSYPRSGTPDSKTLDRQLTQYVPEVSARHKQRDTASYMYTESELTLFLF